MGKAARIACIFTPWALTIASFVCIALVQISGWGSKGTLNEFYFVQVNFTNLDTRDASAAANSTTLTNALSTAAQQNRLARVYQIHLWNYCEMNTVRDEVTYCSPRQLNFYFDPILAWGLNTTNTTSDNNQAGGSAHGTNAISEGLGRLQNVTKQEEDDLLGKAGQQALDAYRSVSKWMFIAYEISFWATLATIFCGVLAIFSRIGSFLTWLFSVVSSLFIFLAVLSSTILFATFTGAFTEILRPYHVTLHQSTQTLALVWLAVLFSWAGTLFWLFSVCCCSGRSNPHHHSNRGGLWNAEASEYRGRGRGMMRVEKTGGGYERVASPYLGASQARHAQEVPLQDYAGRSHSRGPSGAFEPMRHQMGA